MKDWQQIIADAIFFFAFALGLYLIVVLFNGEVFGGEEDPGICRSAVLRADEAQDLVDVFGTVFLSVPRTEQEVKEKRDKIASLVFQISRAYGRQEIASALCLDRPVKPHRLPDTWRNQFQRKQESHG